MTAEERRILAGLEGLAGEDDHGRWFAIVPRVRVARLYARRYRGRGMALVFSSGAVLMVVTFTRWPVVAVAGAVVQVVALSLWLARSRPRLVALSRRWGPRFRLAASLMRLDRNGL
jgi:hypothetical protein